mmetsp:Transcript_36092/g.107880  ORF Transcript_36092/g.107880 Transcript_36092/m.107880 type:complete len:269 (+) Transcript_36092:1003-1809(+)
MHVQLAPPVNAPRGRQAAVQVDVVRHDDGANGRDHLHYGVSLAVGHKPAEHQGSWWRQEEEVNKEAGHHDHDKRENEDFQRPLAKVVHEEEGERVDTGDQRAHPQGPAEKDLQGNGSANNLLDVGAYDCDLCHYPDGPRGRFRVVHPTSLCQVLARDRAQARSEDLEHQAREGAQEEDPDERVPGIGPILQVALKITRVQVGQAHEPAWSRVEHEGPAIEERLGGIAGHHLQRVAIGIRQAAVCLLQFLLDRRVERRPPRLRAVALHG